MSNENFFKIPNNEEAERAVLGALLVEPDRLAEVLPVLQPSDFYSRRHQLVFDQMRCLQQKGTAIDVLTVCEATKGEVEPLFVSQLMDGIPKLSNIRHYAEIVARKAGLREALWTAREVEKYIDEGGEDLDHLRSIGQRLSGSGVDLLPTPDSVESVSNAVLDSLAARQEGIEVPDLYSTGMQARDRIYQYEPGKLFVIAGRPSMGKTALAMNDAVTLCRQGLPGLIFEQEMSKEEILMRLLSSMARVDYAKVRSVSPEQTLSPEEWSRFGAAHEELKSFALYIVDAPSRGIHDIDLTVRTINNKRKAAGENPLGFVIFDYLQIGNLSGRNRVEAIGHFTTGFKNLSREHHFIAICLSQLKRPAQDAYDSDGVPRMPQLSDLRESGCIEQDADLVAFIHRPEYYLRTGGLEVGEWTGVAQFSVAKNRGGETLSVNLGWHGPLMTFHDAVI
jgi:replicative DNA helicase